MTSPDPHEHTRRPAAEHAAAVARLVAPALAALPVEQVVLAELLAEARDAATLPPRALAYDAVAAVALPGFDNSQMDGYAVRAADLAEARQGRPVVLSAGDPVPAGTVPPPLPHGTAVPVMTGAPIPLGADAVVPVEKADPFGSPSVTFTAPVDPGTYVRTAGSDVAAGDVVLRTGTPLGPAQLGALVAAGVDAVHVAGPARVLLVSTGSELAPAGAPLGPAQVFDANGAGLAAALAHVGARVVARVVPDEPAALRAVLADAADVDLVLTTGGVSAGAYEVVRQTFDDAWFGHVAVQPGGPQGCGTVTLGDGRRVPLVAFPGNPVSALVSFELFLRPLLAGVGGLTAHRRVRPAPLAEPLDSPRDLQQVRRGRLDDDGRVRLVGGPGSHLLAHLAAATVLVSVPVGTAHLEPGDTVDIWEF